ncbi:CPBP family intramembrane metalloprotease [Bacillus safensis]|uniref:CPBP family intramembrane glutamic endopeptidase n=1 Tax=Bacillus safensis TaxID=561879 RepID=UPI001F4E97E5|nr:CPBP family intramembrane glutamic endopeptidase [Bacillus safensis]MCM2989909.1 CPBP family intramembrane metalloprotease [Bacillus safensis]
MEWKLINTIMVKNIVSLFLFATLIISIQLNNYLLIAIWAVTSIFLFVTFDKSMKSFVVTNVLFGIGFFVYLYVNSHWTIQFQTNELRIFFNRVSLVFILVPLFILSFFSKSTFITYLKKPQWNELIYFPFIWSGFHRISVKFFLFIALSVNVVSFAPFVIQNGWSFIEEIWLFTIIFSITNAVLEEIIWRGNLLSRLSEQLGEKWAVVVTSLGFGLQHYSLGIPWVICIAFSIGGMFYGGITIKSRSIIPSIIWHIALNTLMVLSGLILT